MTENTEERKKINSKYNFLKFVILTLFCSLFSSGIKSVVLKYAALHPDNSFFGIISFCEVHNTGAAFNILGNFPGFVIVISSVAALLILVFMYIYAKHLSSLYIILFSLMTGGVAVNLYERTVQGYVTDYISPDFIPSFPVFNVSDILIITGAAGISLVLLSTSDKE